VGVQGAGTGASGPAPKAKSLERLALPCQELHLSPVLCGMIRSQECPHSHVRRARKPDEPDFLPNRGNRRLIKQGGATAGGGSVRLPARGPGWSRPGHGAIALTDDDGPRIGFVCGTGRRDQWRRFVEMTGTIVRRDDRPEGDGRGRHGPGARARGSACGVVPLPATAGRG
jgi:hypothetical protein